MLPPGFAAALPDYSFIAGRLCEKLPRGALRWLVR
jgi:hypothetical protein